MLQRLIGLSAMSGKALTQKNGGGPDIALGVVMGIAYHQPMSSSPNKKKWWSGAEKLRIVLDARELDEDELELGALLRREGLSLTDLTAWQAAVEAALPGGVALWTQSPCCVFMRSSGNCDARTRR
jgi:hypothetical protein